MDTGSRCDFSLRKKSISTLLGDFPRDAEAQARIAAVGVLAVADRAAHVVCLSIPRAAAQHSLVFDACVPIAGLGPVGAGEGVLHPLPDVAAHVVQAQPVGLLGSDWVSGVADFSL